MKTLLDREVETSRANGRQSMEGKNFGRGRGLVIEEELMLEKRSRV